MRIKEFEIFKYGPLKNSGSFVLGGLNLIFGRNEEGKTLLIDALIKLLFKSVPKNKTVGKEVNRVDEEPEGRLVLEDKVGGNVKFLDELVSAEAARNIFIIRNSDLFLVEEASFYQEITERLTGIEIGRAEKIRSKLADNANLSPTGRWKQRTGAYVEDLQKRIARVTQFLNDAKEKKYEELETEQLKLKNEIAELEDAAQALERAQKTQKYAKVNDIYQEYQKTKEDLKKFEDYTDAEFDELSSAEQKLRMLNDEIDGLKSEIAEFKELMAALEKDAAAASSERLALSAKQNDVDFLKNTIEKIKERPVSGAAKKALAFGGLLMLLFSGYFFYMASKLYDKSAATFLSFVIVGLVLLAAFIYSLFAVISYETKVKRIILKLNSLGFNGGTVAELLSELAGYYDRLSGAERIANETNDKFNAAKSALEQMQKSLQSKKTDAYAAETAASKIKNLRNADNAAEYKGILKTKREKQAYLKELKNSAGILLGYSDSASFSEEQWRVRLSEFDFSSEKNANVEFSQEELNKIKNKLSVLRDRRNVITGDFQAYKEKLGAFADMPAFLENAGNHLNPAFFEYDFSGFKVNSIADLDEIKKQMDFLADALEKQKTGAEAALTIIDKMRDDKSRSVEELFGAESNVSNYFREITEGKYDAVRYDSAANKIFVETADGVELGSEKLSAGTVDQLYFCIRLELAEKLFGEPGFFILDDPFLKSDNSRLKKQVELLRRLAEKKWQIIYFSAKDEVKDNFDHLVRDKKDNCTIFEAPGLS